MKLSQLKIGQQAKITAINQGSHSLRIMELGIVIGTIIVNKSMAPFGNAVAYGFGDSTISMRKSEAELIEIELLNY